MDELKPNRYQIEYMDNRIETISAFTVQPKESWLVFTRLNNGTVEEAGMAPVVALIPSDNVRKVTPCE